MVSAALHFLITTKAAKTLNVQDQYRIEVGKPANFLVLDAKTPFEAVRQRADVLASVRQGAYLFKRPEPSYEIALALGQDKPRAETARW